jgi:hypothetical protein
MKSMMLASLALTLVLAGPVAVYAAEQAAASVKRHHHLAHRHAAPEHNAAVAAPGAAAAPALIRPAWSPPVTNDSDGLSRDPEDCEKGCLDNGAD